MYQQHPWALVELRIVAPSHWIVHAYPVLARREHKLNISGMDYRPSLREVQAFAEDFREDYGVSMPLEDAERILMLYGEMEDLFMQYAHGGMPIWEFFGG